METTSVNNFSLLDMDMTFEFIGYHLLAEKVLVVLFQDQCLSAHINNPTCPLSLSLFTITNHHRSSIIYAINNAVEHRE
jgi:hypothetical protein